MSRFSLWALIWSGGLVAASLGLCKWGTALDATYFSAVALILQWLYGEDA